MPLGSWYSQLPAFGWFDREDRPGSNALGVPDWQQGIALPSRRTLGQWYNVTPPGGGLPFPMQQTDVGPAKWTGRGVDISAAAAHQMGYTPKNFPTDTEWKVEPRDEPRGLGSPAGLPVQAGDLPDNTTDEAYAAGPRARKTMPNSLMDMFTPTGATGQPVDFGNALAQRSNSLIGLGLGLMQPRSLAVGAPVGNAWTGALGGYMQGAQTDSANAYRQAQLQHQKTQDARQAAMDRFNMGLREREFAQSQLTPYQKMNADLARAKGTPDEQQVADFYRNQLDVKPPEAREVQIGGQNVLQEFDPRTKQWKTATTGGGATAASDPFTTPGGGGVSYGNAGVGERGFGSARPDKAYPGAAGATAAGQPVLAPRKPLTAHEQTAVDESDKALMANRNAIGNLQYAKELSKKAASGLFALERGQAGSYLGGGMFSEGGKETVMLHNTIINNAVDQLKATFGGNPSEGERKILLEMAGSVNSPDAVRQEIYDRGIRLAKEKLAENTRRAREIRSGQYYQPGHEPVAGAPSAAGAVRRYNPETGNIE